MPCCVQAPTRLWERCATLHGPILVTAGYDGAQGAKFDRLLFRCRLCSTGYPTPARRLPRVVMCIPYRACVNVQCATQAILPLPDGYHKLHEAFVSALESNIHERLHESNPHHHHHHNPLHHHSHGPSPLQQASAPVRSDGGAGGGRDSFGSGPLFTGPGSGSNKPLIADAVKPPQGKHGASFYAHA